MRRSKPPFLVVVLLLSATLLATSIHWSPSTAAFAPQPGDYFNYHEVETVANGTGSYAGYSDQTVVNGGERMDGVTGATVSANYSYSYSYSNSEGNSTSGTQSGSYTFSSSSLLYVSGTDDQTGYVNPTIWFAMNNLLPVGGTFSLLNTQMTVISRNYTFYLPTESKNVTTIFASGKGSYSGSPDNDAYGVFNAKYTWNEYFDPSTGYIVGYTYAEQDVSPNGNGTSFGYTDDLYLTAASYPLSAVGSASQLTSLSASSAILPSTFTTIPVAVAPSTSNSGLMRYAGYIVAIILVIVILAILVYALSRRGKKPLPEHPSEQASEKYSPQPPPAGPPPEGIDLIPKEQPPVQQIVIKEVAKVKCTYCGAMMDSTAAVCPRCGAPRT